jgi:bis(5'-nucleosyl)-tetraphosphatase (symmetrical)
VRDLGDRAVVVLGNHDLHLLARALGAQGPKTKDTLDEVLGAPDREPLLEWLRHRPLLHHDADLGRTMVHAGLPPEWDLAQAISCAREAEAALRGSDYLAFFRAMYGDEPGGWDHDLQGYDRLRYIVNAFTRMRMLTPDRELDLAAKGPAGDFPGLTPWFSAEDALWRGETRVVSGHWSALGVRLEHDFMHLDGGCVWGGVLTAVRLEDDRIERLPCPGAQPLG